MTRKLLVATHNPGKVREYREILADLPLEVTYLDAEGITLEVDETGATFAENAILKATTYARLTGLWTWADDSGLVVDALDGAPGVYSARYAGPGATDADRYRKLLDALTGVPWDRRTARFRCTVALATPEGRRAPSTACARGSSRSGRRGATASAMTRCSISWSKVRRWRSSIPRSRTGSATAAARRRRRWGCWRRC